MKHSRKGKTARKTERRMCHGNYRCIPTTTIRKEMDTPSFVDDHVPDYTFDGTIYQEATTHYDCSKGHGTVAHIEYTYTTGDEKQ